MLVWNAAISDASAIPARVGTGAIARPAGQSPAARSVVLAKVWDLLALLVILLAPCSARAGDCIPIHEAGQHIGETKCVTGKIIRVKVEPKAYTFWIFVKTPWPARSRSLSSPTT